MRATGFESGSEFNSFSSDADPNPENTAFM
jgi:hypothetical protein